MITRLNDICVINMGQSPDSSTYNEDGEGLPFFQGNADFGVLYPEARTWCAMPIKVAREGDILISVRAPIGAMNIANCQCCIGRGLAALTVKKGICEQKYLWYALMNKVDDLGSKGTGSTFKAINKRILEETEIPLPSLADQRRIAAVLDKVSDLIAKRRQQLAILDELVKTRFVEMFGTFPANEKKWPVVRIRNVIQEARYGSSRPAVEDGKYPYLRMNNITYSGELDLTDIKQIDVPESELPKCTVRHGDVLFNRTNSKELVGKTCVYNRDEMMVLAGFVIRIRVNEKVLPEFLSEFLNTDFSKQMLLGMCKTAIGQANINAQEMQNIEIYIPPIELQKKYVDYKNRIRKTKTSIGSSLDKLETLKKALMQEYFG